MTPSRGQEAEGLAAAGWGDSNSTVAICPARGQGAVGGTPCGSYERLVSAPARCCPRFAFRLRTQHGPSGVPVPSGRHASGAPVLRDQGPIGRPGTARPIPR